MANWVRFADTKATILTAGLGVILTMLMNNAKTVTSAVGQGCLQALIVGTLAVGALLAFLWTLFWLVRAVRPQTSTKYSQLNRFAWPALQTATAEQVSEHANRVDVRVDAWQQVLELSELAGRKFDACAKAVTGFALLAVFALTCVAVSMGLTA
ncbi:Pycsar system effector family protein [Arthrobacter sp. StoSoilA2]|uniref:Pycsar system effector family protein n=1 Tax=Arthrobacter sp. StoSoilA2 TaxID=2830990 RepID=UPI001CC3D71F|nr:Pycsar system effector family protein [Arthrobacter sp. StoSoilA2]